MHHYRFVEGGIGTRLYTFDELEVGDVFHHKDFPDFPRIKIEVQSIYAGVSVIEKLEQIELSNTLNPYNVYRAVSRDDGNDRCYVRIGKLDKVEVVITLKK